MNSRSSWWTVMWKYLNRGKKCPRVTGKKQKNAAREKKSWKAKNSYKKNQGTLGRGRRRGGEAEKHKADPSLALRFVTCEIVHGLFDKLWKLIEKYLHWDDRWERFGILCVRQWHTGKEVGSLISNLPDGVHAPCAAFKPTKLIRL